MSREPLHTYQDLYGSEYLSPEDLPEGTRLKVYIAKHEVLELTVAKGGGIKKNWKVVLTCQNEKGIPCKKKVAVNKTSAKRFALAWSKDFAKWDKHWISIEGGEVNGRPAVLLTPLKDAPAPTTQTPVEATA